VEAGSDFKLLPFKHRLPYLFKLDHDDGYFAESVFPFWSKCATAAEWVVRGVVVLSTAFGPAIEFYNSHNLWVPIAAMLIFNMVSLDICKTLLYVRKLSQLPEYDAIDRINLVKLLQLYTKIEYGKEMDGLTVIGVGASEQNKFRSCFSHIMKVAKYTVGFPAATKRYVKFRETFVRNFIQYAVLYIDIADLDPSVGLVYLCDSDRRVLNKEGELMSVTREEHMKRKRSADQKREAEMSGDESKSDSEGVSTVNTGGEETAPVAEPIPHPSTKEEERLERQVKKERCKKYRKGLAEALRVKEPGRTRKLKLDKPLELEEGVLESLNDQFRRKKWSCKSTSVRLGNLVKRGYTKEHFHLSRYRFARQSLEATSKDKKVLKKLRQHGSNIRTMAQVIYLRRVISSMKFLEALALSEKRCYLDVAVSRCKDYGFIPEGCMYVRSQLADFIRQISPGL
jgi:hypothetical protein